MKTEKNFSLGIYRGLVLFLTLMMLVLAVGSIYGLLTKVPPQRSAPNYAETAPPGAVLFTGLGQLRISTADPQGGTAVISVIFGYNPEDKPLAEELALRIRDLRSIIADYIGSFSASDLQEADEEIIRAELLRRFNSLLRLGRIETLFLGEFMVIR